MRIKQNGKEKYVVDDFERNAVWIGVFSREEIICCIRFLYRTEDKQLDLDGYTNSLNADVARILKIKNLVEIQRRAAKPAYRRYGINYIMLAVFGKLLMKTNMMNVITTTTKHERQILPGHPFGILLDDNFNQRDGLFNNVIFYSTKDYEKLFQIVDEKYQHLCGNEGSH